MRWTWLAVLVVASGCESIDLGRYAARHAALSRIAPEAPGPRCPHGGQVVFTGTDLDDDGTLADSEVTTAQYVCATALPGVLVRTEEEAPGPRCPQGGQVSLAGADLDGDGLLADGEVTREAVACAEARTVLARVRVEAAGAHCPAGGSAVESGEDRDGNGTLADTEVTATSYVCATNVSVSLSHELPGDHCVSGGTVVRAGVDANEDGTLGDAEVAVTTYVCESARPVPTLNGTYTVRDAVDLVVLQGVQRIRGGLIIEGSNVQTVTLPDLAVVEGPLVIHGNAVLGQVDLSGLVLVRDEVTVGYNPGLAALVLGGDQQQPLRIGGELLLELNGALSTLVGLAWVSPQSLTLHSNNGLLSLDGMLNLNQLSSLTISWNSQLTRLDLASLGVVTGPVSIIGNASLTTLEGTGLYRVDDFLTLRDNPKLQDLSGLEALESLGGLAVSGNAGLVSTAGLDSLTDVHGTINISGNTRLESVGHMPLLARVDGKLGLGGNPKLARVEDLPSLRTLGSLQVYSSPLLTDLSALRGLLRLEYVEVSNSPALTSLADLGNVRVLPELALEGNAALTELGLGKLEQVSMSFQVKDNPKLPTCLVTALADAVYTGDPLFRRISGNDDTATCVPPLPGGFPQ